MTDVQNSKLTNGFRLSRVGVTGVKKPVKVAREGRTTTLFCTIDVFVDLPPTQKGAHLSRNLEVIADIIDKGMDRPVSGIEVLCAEICRELRERHEYSTFAEVNMVADYFLERSGPSGKKTLEPFKIMARAISDKDGPLKKMIGVQVIGMTACPCAMETVREEFRNMIVVNDELPTISHNQRNISTVMIEVPEGMDIEANDLIDIVEGSFSSPTFELLKRSDEAKVVLRAHRSPKFVEDVVRDVLTRIVERYESLPDDVVLTVKSESEESIHKHNAYAERTTTFGELKR